MSAINAVIASAGWQEFCGPDSDACIVEYLFLMWPYYLFFLILLPFRGYEIRLLPPCYPPHWWPLSHLVKRVLCMIAIALYITSLVSLSAAGIAYPYMVLSCVVHAAAWMSAYWILSAEYKRYQPLTWVGLRGFWFLTGIEGGLRLFYLLSVPEDSMPLYLGRFSSASEFVILSLSVLELLMAVVVVWVPADLSLALLGHIQRLLLEHPSAAEDGMASSRPEAIYTLHEDDQPRNEGYQSKRADTPGWIYSVEEELPFRPKIDVVDVFVLAINRNKRIKTVYRIHTRVTTDSDPPMFVEFNVKRRYRELRWLDDQLRGVFEHSAYPEQRAFVGSFPPRELTQADPFARQVALREYLRRLSQNPFFYCQEFLDMVGIDTRFDAGRLYESCLALQQAEQSKVKIRKVAGPAALPAVAGALPGGTITPRLTQEVMPWRPPMLLSSSLDSPIGSIPATPPGGPGESKGFSWTVIVPEFVESRKVVYYKILTSTPMGTFESKHRFSDFQRLNVHLRDFLDIGLSAKLPSMVRLGLSQTAEQFLEDRREKLQHYLQTLLAEFPQIVATSRFVRTFLKLSPDALPYVQTDSEMMTDEDGGHSSRVTPTSVKWSLAESLGAEGGALQSPTSPIEIHERDTTVSVPFFSYCFETDPPRVSFCVRIQTPDNEWTRFHTFEQFQKLRSDLDVRHAYLSENLDFPTSHLWSLPSANEAGNLKLLYEGRRRVLAHWLGRLVAQASDDGIEDIEPLRAFIELQDAYDHSYLYGQISPGLLYRF